MSYSPPYLKAPSSDKEMVEAVTLDEKLIARLRDGQSPSALDYKRLLFLASQGIRRSPAPAHSPEGEKLFASLDAQPRAASDR